MGGPGANRDRESEESKEVVARQRRVGLCSMHAHFSNGPSSSWLYWRVKGNKEGLKDLCQRTVFGLCNCVRGFVKL